MSASGRPKAAIVHLEGRGEHGYGEEVTFQAGDLPVESSECGGHLRNFGEFSLWLGSRICFSSAGVRGRGTTGAGPSKLPPSISRSDKPAPGSTKRRARLGAHELRRLPRPRLHGFPPGARLKVDADDLRPDLPVDVIDFKGARRPTRRSRRRSRSTPMRCSRTLRSSFQARESAGTSGSRLRRRSHRLPERPTAINIKPARLGSFGALFELYKLCDAEGIDMYGGGQHELGPGREHIQLLASLFHPQAPNDVAPAGYNEPNPRPRSRRARSRSRPASASGLLEQASRPNVRPGGSSSSFEARGERRRRTTRGRSCRGGA